MVPAERTDRAGRRDGASTRFRRDSRLGSASKLASGDVDDDGDLDLVEAPGTGLGHLSTASGRPEGAAACKLAPLGGDNGTTALAVADVDRRRARTDIVQGDETASGPRRGGWCGCGRDESGARQARRTAGHRRKAGRDAGCAAPGAEFGHDVDAGRLDGEDEYADIVDRRARVTRTDDGADAVVPGGTGGLAAASCCDTDARGRRLRLRRSRCSTRRRRTNRTSFVGRSRRARRTATPPSSGRDRARRSARRRRRRLAAGCASASSRNTTRAAPRSRCGRTPAPR